MKEIQDSLLSYFQDQDSTFEDGSLYHFLKPKLCANHIFPQADELAENPSRYLKFQIDLQEIASYPRGMNLALALMVEVNVAVGILLHSDTEKALELKEKVIRGNYILATGVSEPGWEGTLKKLKSNLGKDFKLNGTKSFITNGGSANGVLWVVPRNHKYEVYFIDLELSANHLKRESIITPFLHFVSHNKISAVDLPLKKQDLVCEDYSKLGIELRLKELFSLVSLLLGYVEGLRAFIKHPPLEEKWTALRKWRDTTAKDLVAKNYLQVLEEAFPFPIDSLLSELAVYFQLNDVTSLPTRDPDLAIFLWEDLFTKFLIHRKSRKIKDQ
ncbi:acyl-CoA dehydrogenase [Leptospira ognonensis]|uniref:Acyl-CoA dehydrogenase n=1 Tax=Leptospira ognonensis TaxID=2484945 RepID=A0A4R9KFK3_9LEPT|nr:acyl-CoA dehydrogenase [Leptospira ognonensis]TGL63992.1 acyl-CoA dehydrogenase [Leptospira ognonensis]